MSDRNSGNDFLTFVLGVFVGAAVGIISSLLLAPQSGQETRKKIGEGVNHLKENAHDSLEDIREKTEQTVAEARKRADKIVDEAKERADSIVKDAKHRFERVKPTEEV